MRWFRNNGLSVVLLLVFLLCAAVMAVAGRGEYNGDQRDHGQPTVSFVTYLGTSHFWQALAENWESEFLEIAMYVVLTKHLYQKGSGESKDPDDENASVDEDPRDHANDPAAPWPVRRGGFVLWLFEHSLSLTFFGIFLLVLGLHVIVGYRNYTHGQVIDRLPKPDLGDYLLGGKFFFESMQNWQSEFLSILAMVLGTKYLRERCSPESKPVAMATEQNP